MNWHRALGASVAGLAASLAFPPSGLAPLAFVAWAPLLLALGGATLVQGAALGFTAGTVFFAVVLRWLPALSLPLWIAVSLYLALYVAAFGAIATRLLRGPRVARLAVPAAWVALEWLRGWMFGGFPWAELGTALASDPRLLSLASLGGVALLSLAIVSCNLAVAVAGEALWRGARLEAGRAALLAVAIPAALAFHGLLLMPASDASVESALDIATAERSSAVATGERSLAVLTGERSLAVLTGERSLAVLLIGGDTDPRIATEGNPFGRAIQDYVAKTDRALEAGHADLAIWPETALPHPLEEGGLAIHARALRRRVEQQWGIPLLFGVPAAAETGGFRNEAQLWSAREVARYQKRRLVPFGEFAFELPLVGSLGKVLPGPEVVAGQGGAPFVVGGMRLGVLICFEDLFSADALERAAESDALVILTNDVWLDEAGAAQHMAAAVLRAVETGRWIARVANHGVTAIIDPQGRSAPAALAPQRLVKTEGRTLYAATPGLVPSIALVVTIAALAASWKSGLRVGE